MDRTRRSRLRTLLLVGLLLGSAVGGSASAGAAAGQDGQAANAGVAALSPETVDPDAVDITVSLQSDGDARWTVAYRMRLQTDNETQAFRDLQADVQNNTSAYLDRFRERISSTVAVAENTTGRQMRANNFSVSTRLQPFGETDYGILTYSFTWTNFARVDGPRLLAGDAISGFYLDNETSLSFTYPEPYGLVSVDPTPSVRRAGVVGWTGPFDFTAEEPRLVVSTEAATTTATTGEPGTDGGLGTAGFAALALVAVLLVVGAAWYFRGRGGVPGGAGGGEGGEGGGPGGAGAEAGAGAPAETPAPEEATGEAGGEAVAPASDTEEPPEELLSNEERVKRFLREHGGRAKQQEIVEGLGWTEAKTSQVLKGMREEDELEGFRIGRENVIKLPDAEEPSPEGVEESDESGI